MAAPKTATRKPAATAAQVPSYRKPLTLLERLQEAPRWVIKRGPGSQPERLTLYKGKRPVAICSVSLRLMQGADKGAQKALHTAAETLEALSDERERLLSFLGTGASADGKSVADWLKAIEHAQAQEARWKENYHEAAAEIKTLREELTTSKEDAAALESTVRRLEFELRETETRAGKYAAELDDLRTVQSELRAILMPAIGIEPENWAAYSLTDAAQGLVEISASRLEESSRHAQRVREVSDQLEWRMGDIGKLRAIVMPALGIPPETQAQHSLIEASETLVAAYLERGFQAGELRESLRNRNEQITALVKERDEALTVNRGLSTALESEQATNRAHQHARKMGWLMSIGALLLSIPLTLWISGFWSWRAGR